MLIGELSRCTGVNAHQLRYYEAQGLLEADRGANGYREYGEDAVLRVKQIRHLLDAGLSSEDIAYLLPCAAGEAPDLVGCPELLAAMRSRLERLDDQMARLARSRHALADYIDAAERVGSESRDRLATTRAGRGRQVEPPVGIVRNLALAPTGHAACGSTSIEQHLDSW